MSTPLRMPISTASRKGVSAIVEATEQQSILLTNYGRAVARVDGPEPIESIMGDVREAKLAILDAAGDLVSGRSTRLNLDEVCSRLGLDADRIRAIAAERQAGRK